MNDEAERLEDLARSALAEGNEESVLESIAPAAERLGNARLWQFAGLLQRALDRHSEALISFSAAAGLAPNDPSIAHGRARVAWEAGVDSVGLFERALKLAPANGEVLTGLAAAKFAVGRGAEAEAELDAALSRSPMWIEGHRQLAQLRSMLGQRDRSTASIERALGERRDDKNLWATLFDLVLAMGNFELLEDRLQRARSSGCVFLPFEAIAAAELGQADRADRLFAQMAPADREAIGAWHVRHLVRAGRIEEAARLVDRMIGGERASEFWPYAYIVWRLAGDPRWEWLDAAGTLVKNFDLTDRLPSFNETVERLRSLHVADAEYLDQSVRGGTQTDGPLLSRIEPEIRELRQAIVDAVRRYLSDLPAPDPAHPLLGWARNRPVRFAGSWSVRLKSAGYHENHVHPQGWISSALYFALPQQPNGEPPDAGHLKLGEPPSELCLGLGPTRLVKPEVGRLVLFPSWLWHGTVPFTEGERLTVAFDVRPPR